MKKGNFIIITGTDGSGKTTLVNQLKNENLPNTVFFDSYQNGKRDLKNLVLLELQKPCYICSQPFISRNFHMKNKFRNR